MVSVLTVLLSAKHCSTQPKNAAHQLLRGFCTLGQIWHYETHKWDKKNLLKEPKMSTLCSLSELYNYLCQLNTTKNSTGCQSTPNQNHANHEQEINTKSLSPTQFLQTQDEPLGKHRQQNTFSEGSLTAERQKQRKISEKKLLHSRNKTLRMGT